jgi:hypothetical protein
LEIFSFSAREKRDISNTSATCSFFSTNDETLTGFRHNRLAIQIYGDELPWERPHSLGGMSIPPNFGFYR